MHLGGELDARYRINSKLVVYGMFSYGNWEYAGDVDMQFIDEDNNATDVDVDGDGAADKTLYLDGVKVGDAAQMTARLGLDYRVYKGLKLDGSFLFADNLYAAIDPTSFIRQDHDGSLKLPSYGLLDLGASYKMYIGKKRNQSLNFRVNVNNVLNKTYISESETNRHAQTAADFATDAEYQDYLNNDTYEGIDASN